MCFFKLVLNVGCGGKGVWRKGGGRGGGKTICLGFVGCPLHGTICPGVVYYARQPFIAALMILVDLSDKAKAMGFKKLAVRLHSIVEHAT